MSEEGRELLDELGREFADRLDNVIDALKRDLERSRAPLHVKDAAFRQYLELASEDQRDIKLAVRATQTFAHGLFAWLDWSTRFRLVADGGGGDPVDLKRYSDLFAGEPDEWFENYSKHGSVAGRCLEIAATIKGDLR